MQKDRDVNRDPESPPPGLQRSQCRDGRSLAPENSTLRPPLPPSVNSLSSHDDVLGRETESQWSHPQVPSLSELAACRPVGMSRKRTSRRDREGAGCRGAQRRPSQAWGRVSGVVGRLPTGAALGLDLPVECRVAGVDDGQSCSWPGMGAACGQAGRWQEGDDSVGGRGEGREGGPGWFS